MVQRVAHIVAVKRFIHRVGAKCHRHRQRATGQAFGQANHIGRNAELIAGKQCAGATKAGHHFVGDRICTGGFGGGE